MDGMMALGALFGLFVCAAIIGLSIEARSLVGLLVAAPVFVFLVTVYLEAVA